MAPIGGRSRLGTARVGIAAILLVVVSACGAQSTDGTVSSLSYPASPTLERFGVIERCGRGDPSCEEQAGLVIPELLSHLGETYDGDGLTTTELSEALPNYLAVRVESSEALSFRAAAHSGSARTTMIDLTGLVDGQSATYVVVNAPDGPMRFEVPRGQAERLLNALFVATP